MLHIWEILRYFKQTEFSHPDEMNTELLLKLDWARHKAELPFHITSSYRARDNRTHGKGLAVDIACIHSRQRLSLIDSLRAVGIERIGIYPNHLHADVSISDPPGIWYGTYPKGVTDA